MTYRRVRDFAECREVFRLRHEAYLREGAILPQPDDVFLDDVDFASNTFLFGVYIDDVLAGSIRLSVTIDDDVDLPTTHVFPEYVGAAIRAGKVVIDPTRFVADFAASRKFPELAYLTLRLPWLAMEHFDGDLMLAAIRPEHEPFYRRLWGNELVAEARMYPGLLKPVALTVLDFRAARDRVLQRYPFFASTEAERRRFFEPSRSFPMTAEAQRYRAAPVFEEA